MFDAIGSFLVGRKDTNYHKDPWLVEDEESDPMQIFSDPKQREDIRIIGKMAKHNPSLKQRLINKCFSLGEEGKILS